MPLLPGVVSLLAPISFDCVPALTSSLTGNSLILPLFAQTPYSSDSSLPQRQEAPFKSSGEDRLVEEDTYGLELLICHVMESG
jgi:hypothetical protein